MGDSFKKKQVLLDEAEIELTIIGNDRLALAELVAGTTTQEELIRRLAANGVRAGYIENGLNLLVEGKSGQIPIASAKIRQVPGLSSMPLFKVEVPSATEDWSSWNGANLDQKVEEGDLLVQVEAPPIVSIIRVNGSNAELERGESLNAKDFAGVNTVVNEDNTTVQAEISGYAFRGIFGQAAVTEAEEVPALAKAHGKLRPEGSLLVRGEISKGAVAEVEGSLIAHDHLDGATITAYGNVYVSGDIKNEDKMFSCDIRAGQSVRGKSVNGATIWAGADIHVIDLAKDAKLSCLGEAVIQTIEGGELRVGKGLIAHDVGEDAALFLGSRHIETKDLASEQVLLVQHIGRLADTEQTLLEHRREFAKSKASMLGELEKVRSPDVSSALKQKAMSNVALHIQLMNEALMKFEGTLQEYVDFNMIVEHDQARINYYQHRLEMNEAPEAIITGSVAKGVRIFGPGGMLEVTGGLENVRIAPDAFTGIPQVYSL